MMHAIIARFKDLRVIPVIAIDRSEDAMPLADALVEGGLPCAEIYSHWRHFLPKSCCLLKIFKSFSLRGNLDSRVENHFCRQV